MKPDSEIKRHVEEELRSSPQIEATDIGVTVKDAVVTLTDFVRSYREKSESGRPNRVASIRACLRHRSTRRLPPAK